MTGKEKCRLLRRIRNEVAEKNGLKPFEDTCTHTGKCLGTCPKCEAEVRALSKALENRRARRKRVALAGVSLGVCAALTGCTIDEAIDTVKTVRSIIRGQKIEETVGEIGYDLTGDVEMIPEEILTGEVDDEGVEFEMGAIATEQGMSDQADGWVAE